MLTARPLHYRLVSASADNPSPIPVNESGDLTVSGSPVAPAAEVQTGTMAGIAVGDVGSIVFRGATFGYRSPTASNGGMGAGLAQAFDLGSYDTWHGVVAGSQIGDLFKVGLSGLDWGYLAAAADDGAAAAGLAAAYTNGAFEVWRGLVSGVGVGRTFVLTVGGVAYQVRAGGADTAATVSAALATAYTSGSFDTWSIGIAGVASGTETITVTIPGDLGGPLGDGVWSYSPVAGTTAANSALALRTLITTTYPATTYTCSGGGSNIALTKNARGVGAAVTTGVTGGGVQTSTASHQITGVAGAGASPWAATTDGTATVILTAASKANQSTAISGTADGGGSFSMARTTYGCSAGGGTPWVASADGTANVVLTAASRGTITPNAWTFSATGTGTLSQVHDVTGTAAAGSAVWTATHPGSTATLTYHTTGPINAPTDDLTFAVAGTGTVAVVISPVGRIGDLASCTDGLNSYQYAVQIGDGITQIVAGLYAQLSSVGGYSEVNSNPVIAVTGPGPFADYSAFTLADNSTLQPGSTLALAWAVTTPAVQPLPTAPTPQLGGFGSGALVCRLGGLTSYKVDLWGFFAATGTWAAISTFSTATILQDTVFSVDLTPYNSVYAYVHTFVGTGTATVDLEAQ